MDNLVNNMSMAQCWLDCDHFVWFFTLYFGSLCFLRLLYLLPTLQNFISFWMDTPLHNNALFQCWIKFILYIQIIRHCLKTISNNGVSLKKQRFYFLPIHHFRLVRSFFMMHQHLISNILVWIYFSSINIWEPSYKSILNISILNTIKFTHVLLTLPQFYFIGYYCYYA